MFKLIVKSDKWFSHEKYAVKFMEKLIVNKLKVG